MLIMIFVAHDFCLFLPRIIQTYVMREESGLMTSEKMDLNKVRNSTV